MGATVFKPCATGYIVITLIFEAEKKRYCTTEQQQPLLNGVAYCSTCCLKNRLYHYGAKKRQLCNTSYLF